MIDTIAVGVDGSPESRRAFEFAAGLAAGLGAGLVLVHAVGLLEHRDDPEHHIAADRLRHLVAPDVLIEQVVRPGDPVVVLEAVAAERHVDLLVVGARGVGGAPSALLGSTSSQLLRRSTIPVTVVPAGVG
jgi:nucleotide-binding universal stress UspA family protein